MNIDDITRKDIEEASRDYAVKLIPEDKDQDFNIRVRCQHSFVEGVAWLLKQLRK